jgi:hypothetical protein
LLTAVYRHSAHDLYRIQIQGEPEPIRCTAQHPFWSADRQEFIQADALEIGENLLTIDNKLSKVESLNHQNGAEAVFNLEVDGQHVYFIGETGILVHNTCPPALAIIKRQHGLTPHNRAIDTVFRDLRNTRTGIDFRKNQALVDVWGNKLTNLRPDLQWTDRNGFRHVLQVIDSNPVTHQDVFEALGIIYHQIVL